MMSKTIFVVGASRGIGKATVELFAQNSDFEIHAFARKVDVMESNFSKFENVKCHALDLAQSDIASQLKYALDSVNHIDILINNAGYLVNKPFPELTHEDISTSYQVNVVGVMQTVQALLPKMEKTHIVNISSVGGFQGSVKFPGLAAYSTSKAALCSFTELFSEEYKETNIAMNCLCLGAVQTEMLEEAFPGYQAPVSPNQMAEYIVDFALKANQWMKGKIIPVSLSTP